MEKMIEQVKSFVESLERRKGKLQEIIQVKCQRLLGTKFRKVKTSFVLELKSPKTIHFAIIRSISQRFAKRENHEHRAPKQKTPVTRVATLH